MPEVVDLRADTVTKPTAAMRAAMADAEVGDDVYGEDPTVATLEEEVAARFGAGTALFVPSGIMATQVLLRLLAPVGTEVVCESDAHVVAYEAGAAAALAGVQFRTLDGDRGRLDAGTVRAGLRPAVFPYTQTSLVSVEETTNRGGGAVHGLARLRDLRALADERGLRLHVDGARIFNAVVASGAEEADYGVLADGLSFCVSKGLGAPVGSLLVVDADRRDEALLWRRRLGGAMRQVGVLAAAARHALDHHVERLADDHANARLIADLVADAHPGAVAPDEVETNIVYVDLGDGDAAQVVDELAADGIRVGAMGPSLLRLVTHLDVDTAGARRAGERLARVLGDRSAA